MKERAMEKEKDLRVNYISGIFFQLANPRAAKQRSKVEQCSSYRCKHRLRLCIAPASRD